VIAYLQLYAAMSYNLHSRLRTSLNYVARLFDLTPLLTPAPVDRCALHWTTKQ
jgi:hypothetical protein